MFVIFEKIKKKLSHIKRSMTIFKGVAIYLKNMFLYLCNSNIITQANKPVVHCIIKEIIATNKRYNKNLLFLKVTDKER